MVHFSPFSEPIYGRSFVTIDLRSLFCSGQFCAIAHEKSAKRARSSPQSSPSLPPFSLATTEHEKGPLAKLARAQKKITKHPSLSLFCRSYAERAVGGPAGLGVWDGSAVSVCVCGRATNDVESRASAEDISYRNLCSKNPCV